MNTARTARHQKSTTRADTALARAGSRDPPQHGANGWLALVGIVTLSAATLLYVFVRPADSVYFLPATWSPAVDYRSWLAALSNHFPDFAHVYAFILLTVSVSPWPARVWPVCFFWWLLDSLFEFGQYPAVARHIAAYVPDWFQHVPILDNTANYFLRGTFDTWDLVAIAFGALVAVVTIRVIRGSGVRHAQYF